jgi:predicted RND superfamily exporter protein
LTTPFYQRLIVGDGGRHTAITLETTGQALLTTSIVLSLGFSVFLFATMPNLQLFGGATAIAIILAFLADIVVARALVTLATRNRQRPGVPSL